MLPILPPVTQPPSSTTMTDTCVARGRQRLPMPYAFIIEVTTAKSTEIDISRLPGCTTRLWQSKREIPGGTYKELDVKLHHHYLLRFF
jgi:hypothetical protein